MLFTIIVCCVYDAKVEHETGQLFSQWKHMSKLHLIDFVVELVVQEIHNKFTVYSMVYNKLYNNPQQN